MCSSLAIFLLNKEKHSLTSSKYHIWTFNKSSLTLTIKNQVTEHQHNVSSITTYNGEEFNLFSTFISGTTECNCDIFHLCTHVPIWTKPPLCMWHIVLFLQFVKTANSWSRVFFYCNQRHKDSNTFEFIQLPIRDCRLEWFVEKNESNECFVRL